MTRSRAALAVGAGLLLTAGLPPFGWWPLALLGAGGLAALLRGRPVRARAGAGALAGMGFLAPGLFWMWEFSPPGYVLSFVVESAMFALGAAVVPPRRGWALGLPGALVLAEALRGRWPFGGVPIATLAQTQLGGPLPPAGRLGGTLLVAGLVAAAGVAIAAAVRRDGRPAVTAVLVVVVLAAVGALLPAGEVTGRLDAALVQGGGPRGTRAVDDPDAPVFERHLAASADVEPGLDLVLWPEDVVDVDDRLEGSDELEELSALAERLDTTLLAGIVLGLDDRFRNEILALDPSGRLVDRYEKNQRVPFGEYIPARALVERVADVGAIPRDATVGTEPGLIQAAGADLGVLISYEVFFARRARDAMAVGAEVLLVPTNASSFSNGQMPALELGAARQRAIETGRDVLQAAPTGFTAVIDPDGRVRSATDLGARAILRTEVPLRTGETPYTRLGDGPLVALAALLLAAGWARARARGLPSDDAGGHGGRAVVPPGEVHAG